MNNTKKVGTVYTLIILIVLVAAAIIIIYTPQNNESVSSIVNVTNAKNHLSMPTYDGFNQAVHPDIVYIPDGWNGYKYWMALTPYPNGNDFYENPSILASNNGFNWEVPLGLKNPVITSPNPGYNADPDIIYNNNTNELFVYFFRYWTDTKVVKLTLMKSSDGVNWSEPQYLITWNRNQEDNGRSFSVIKDNELWIMYYERGIGDTTWVERRISNNGVNWGKPQKVNIAVPNRNIWHIDVHPYKNNYLMLIAAYPKGLDGRQCDLFYAFTEDKVNWNTTSDPVLKNSDYGWDNANIYRSTFLVNGTFFKIWYSATNTKGEWHIGYTEDSNWSFNS